MPYAPQFVKPSRTHANQPSLTRAVMTNVLEGRETSLVLDLNILSAMQEVVSQDLTLAEAGLEDLVKFLNAHPVSIVPGLAFHEASGEHTKTLPRDYRRFLARHCPGYACTPDSLRNYAPRSKNETFQELDTGEQLTLVGSYAAMLTIQIIAKEYLDDSSERKFKAFVDYMAMEVDLLSGMEAEVAAYWFFDRDDVDDEEFKRSCKAIRDNFNKGGKGLKRLRRTLNYARDLWYLRSTAFQDGKLVHGVNQDTWFVTADQALVELAKTIHFCPYDGEAAKYFTLSRHSIQKSNLYWRYCDRVFRGAAEKRFRTQDKSRPITEDEYKVLLSEVRLLEYKVKLYWSDAQ